MPFHPPTHHTGEPAHHAHDGHAPEGLQRSLDLHAEVFADGLTAALDLVPAGSRRHVVDVGAGSGAGSRLLRRRHPDATLTCLDHDPAMLDLLRERGFTAVDADLDAAFPDLDPAAGAPDLVWAASSLHHLQHPDRLLADVRAALDPDGVLVVLEMAGLPRFLDGTDGEALERRCHAAAAAAGANAHPDWTPVIEAAGFDVVRHDLPGPAPASVVAREHAVDWLRRFADLDTLTDADRAGLTELLPRVAADLPLTPVSPRTVWLATPRP